MNYRVWNAVNLAAPTYHSVKSPLKGWELIEALKKIQEKDITIVCNTFGLEVLDNESWEEWSDDLLRTIAEFEDPAEIPTDLQVLT